MKKTSSELIPNIFGLHDVHVDYHNLTPETGNSTFLY